MSDAAFIRDWNEHVDRISAGLAAMRRSSRVGLLPQLSGAAGTPREIALFLDVAPAPGGARAPLLRLVRAHGPAAPFSVSTNGRARGIHEPQLRLAPGTTSIDHVFDGLGLKIAAEGHLAQLRIIDRDLCRGKVVLALESATLAPALAESSLLRTAQRNMSADEVLREGTEFSASWGTPIELANAEAGAVLELYFENAQPGRDALWQATLRVTDRRLDRDTDHAVTHVTHAPFTVAQSWAPRLEAEAGSILAQWHSSDREGMQWRFAVDTVRLTMMAQSVGESLLRGRRFSSDGMAGIAPREPVHARFARTTEITVRPTRRLRRYTVHPGDVLSTLHDAELESLVTEMAYPLELTYRRSAQSKRKVLIGELQGTLGLPVMSLPPLDDWESSQSAALANALEESMSATLAGWFSRQPANATRPLRQTYLVLRARHLANRASFRNRVAQFPLTDAASPDGTLDLDEDVSARLRDRSRGAAPLWPLPLDLELPAASLSALQAFVASEPAEQALARNLPIGLLNMIEFAAELLGVLATPVSDEVRLFSLSLSALGATGAMKAAFDEGRTVFDIECRDGQPPRLVKTRIGRIGIAWNRAIHVVVYERSTAPGDQFRHEQPYCLGRPLIRKMEEYVEVTQPRRPFAAEPASLENRPGCIHSFGFATRRIYVNGAWGRDLADNSGYEIPLWNEDDRSGFYTKPWLGPIAEGGADVLVQHWHEHPQNVYFYSSARKGAGSDSDKWDAVPGLDCDNRVCFGNLAAGRIEAPEYMAHRIVPAYTLAAADEPRFAMRVRADGPSNLAHGRGNDKLLAPLATIHMERTTAVARLSLKRDDPLIAGLRLEQDIDNLWNSARRSAEIKSVEATIASVMRNADALRAAMGTADELLRGCPAFKQRLKRDAGAAFDEADARLGAAAQPLKDIDVGSIAQAHHARLQEYLSSRITLPSVLLQAACREAGQMIDDARAAVTRWAALPEAELLVAARRLGEAWDAAGLRVLLARAQDGLAEPGRVVEQACEQLRASQRDVVAILDAAGKAVGDLLTAVAPIINGAAPVPAQSAIDWLDKLAAAGAVILRQTSDLAAAVRAARLPGPLEGWRSTQDECIAAMATARAGLQANLATAADLRRRLDSGELADAAAIKAGLADAADKLRGWVADAKAAGTALGPKVDAVQAQLKAVLAPLATVRAGLAALMPDLSPALEDLVTAIKSGNPIGPALVQVDQLLASVQTTVRTQDGVAGAALAATLNTLQEVAEAALAPPLAALVASLQTVQGTLQAGLHGATTALQTQLIETRTRVLAGIDTLDCGDWERLRADLERQIGALVEDVKLQVADGVAGLFDADTRRRVAVLKDDIANAIETASAPLKDAYERVAPIAGQAVKLMRLLSEPPELPQITVNCSHLECVLDDVAKQIETSPFVARLRDIDAGMKELGIAIPSRQILDYMVPDALEGLDFRDVVRQVGIDFEAFFAKFQLPRMPTDAIRFSHHVDVQTRTAQAKAELHHQFGSTEQLFDIGSFSLDIRKPKVDATANFTLVDGATGKAQTSARFGGDWILNFGGQPLVTFHDANVQFSDSAGFKFDLDPARIEPHPALLFVSTILKAKAPKLPEGVQIVKDDEGRPIGACIEQRDAIGPYDVGPLFIGETVLASRFELRFESGRMRLDTSFSIGDVAAPVFMQIGTYGGGGWIKGRAWLAVRDGELVPAYEASIGVSLGSARAFTLASVATGSYALRLFAQAAFESAGGNAFGAGLSVTGSARILGYLNAHLALLLEVEHGSGGAMQGKGRLDVEIEICWCYSVRVDRSVQQSI